MTVTTFSIQVKSDERLAMIFFKTVTLNNTLYLRQEDVVEMIREMAGPEETDVRTRFNEMANNIAALKPKPGC